MVASNLFIFAGVLCCIASLVGLSKKNDSVYYFSAVLAVLGATLLSLGVKV